MKGYINFLIDDETACDVLQDLRKMIETFDFSGLKASIEKLQRMYQNMENALYEYNSLLGGTDPLEYYKEEKKKLKKNIKILRVEALKIHNGKMIYKKDSAEYKAYLNGLAKGYNKASEKFKEKKEKK